MRDEDDAFYVGIANPKDFRRELLSSGKDTINLMQKLEHIKDVRTEKVKKMYEFEKVLNEINMIIGKLNRVLPVTKLHGLKEMTKPHHTGTDLTRLQNELSLIESRLDKLL